VEVTRQLYTHLSLYLWFPLNWRLVGPQSWSACLERKYLAPFYLGDPLKKDNVDGKMQYAWKR